MAHSANSTGHFQSRLERRARPGVFAVVSSIIIHAAAVGGAAYARSGVDAEFDDFQTYRVKIYSPPPQVEGPQQLTPPEPAPAPPAPEPKNKAVEEPKPQPKPPEKPKPKPESKPVVKAPAEKTEKPKSASTGKETPKPVVGPNARPDSPGGENLDIDIAGAEFPFPGYQENVILQINRYFRWNGACNLSTRVGFYIREDGSVMSPRVLNASGNREFDRAALRALDMIDKAKAFGPLPKEFTLDRLGVAYTFDPPCGR